MSFRSVYRLWPQYVVGTMWRIIVICVCGICLWWCNSYFAGFMSAQEIRDVQFMFLVGFGVAWFPFPRNNKDVVIPRKKLDKTVVQLPITRTNAMSDSEWQKWVEDHSDGK